nr:hypothetical protein [Gammaproteobacteria bacterium]
FQALRTAVERLQAELTRVRGEAEAYRQIIDTLADKLVEVQEGCDERQRLLLQSVVTWLFARLNQSQR